MIVSQPNTSRQGQQTIFICLPRILPHIPSRHRSQLYNPPLPLLQPSTHSSSFSIRHVTMAEAQIPPPTIEVNDAIFCTHYKEVVRYPLSLPYDLIRADHYRQCSDCGFDGREENDAFLGVRPPCFTSCCYTSLINGAYSQLVRSHRS